MQDVRQTILLVDDERDVLAMTGLVLERHGFRVLKAASGVEALRMSQQEPGIGLVITDIQMPGMTGPELVRRLRSLGCVLPVLYISGYAAKQPDCEQEAGLIEKPFSPKQLAAKVDSILQGRPAKPVSAAAGLFESKAAGVLVLALSAVLS